MEKTYRPDAAKITACFKEQERNPVCMGNPKSLRQRAETEVLNLGERGLSMRPESGPTGAPSGRSKRGG